MAFKLEKGSKFDIKKALSKVRVGVGWDPIKTNGKDFDIDLHVFGCVNKDGNPKFLYAPGTDTATHAITYANKDSLKVEGKKFSSLDGSLTHYGDSLKGDGDGDDEIVDVDFDLLPVEINDLSIFVTIHEATARRQHFGLVNNAYVHLTDTGTGTELCRYDLKSEFNGLVTIQLGSLIKNNGWSFVAVAEGTAEKELGDVLGDLS